MVTETEITEAIGELGTAVFKLSALIEEMGREVLIAAYREHALKGFYHFCQECALIFGGTLEDIE